MRNTYYKTAISSQRKGYRLYRRNYGLFFNQKQQKTTRCPLNVLPAVRYYFYLLRPSRDFRNTVSSSCWPPAAQITEKKHRKLSNFRQKTLKTNPKIRFPT